MNSQGGITNKRDLDQLYGLAKDSVRLWGLSSPPQFLSESENIVYRIPGKPEYILRLTEERHRSLNAVRAEMAFMQFLAASDVSVAAPVSSQKGKLVEQIRGDTSSYCACLFEKASGVQIGVHKLYNDIKNAEKLGRYLGKIHKLSTEYKPALPFLKRHRYRNIDEIYNALDILPLDAKDARMEFEKAIAWYDSLPVDDASYGLVHMDAHGDNMFINSRRELTLIDFDDCAYNFFAYDLAVPLYYLDSQNLPEKQKKEFRKRFLEVYLDTYPLSHKWIDSLDGFIRLRVIEMYIWGWKMRGAPVRDGKIVHFTRWRNNNSIEPSKPYPVLRDENTVYVSACADDPTKGEVLFRGKTYSCLLGENGIVPAVRKEEGDGTTPQGVWMMRRVFYRADKCEQPKTKLAVHAIKQLDAWCDSTWCDYYNCLVTLPHDGSYEKMWRKDDLYDLVIELGYNDDPPVRGKGSAIFMHVMHPDNTPTKGCVAMKRQDLYSILLDCSSATRVSIGVE